MTSALQLLLTLDKLNEEAVSFLTSYVKHNLLAGEDRATVIKKLSGQLVPGNLNSEKHNGKTI